MIPMMTEYVVTALRSGDPGHESASMTNPVKRGTMISAVCEITIIPSPRKKIPQSLKAYTMSLLRGFLDPSLLLTGRAFSNGGGLSSSSIKCLSSSSNERVEYSESFHVLSL